MAFIDIFGSLTDQSGVPVVGARIIIAAQRNSSVAFRDMTVAQITGEDGAYAFSLAPGYYRVLISYNNDRRTVMTGDMKLEEGSEPGTLNDYVIFAEPVLATPTIYSEIKSWYEESRNISVDVSGQVSVVTEAAQQAQENAQATLQGAESASASAQAASNAQVTVSQAQGVVETARDEAVAARDVAQAAAATTGLMPDIATGLAKTQSGESFSVAQGSGADTAIITYLNNNGVAVETARLAGTEYIRSRLPDVSSPASYVPLFVDEAGSVPVWLKDGKLCAEALDDALRDVYEAGVSSKVPLFQDVAGNIPLWLEEGMLNAAALHPNLLNGLLTPGLLDSALATRVIKTAGDTLWLHRAKKARLETPLAARLKIGFTGDSWTEHKTIPQVFADYFYAKYGKAGDGWIQLNIDNDNLLNGITLSKSGWTVYDASATSASPVYPTSMDGQYIYASGTAATMSLANLFTTTLKIFYYDGNGTFNYSVNGSNKISVSGTGTNTIKSLQVTGLSVSAASVIAIDISGNTGTVVIYGFYAEGSGIGIEIDKMGNGGITAPQYTKTLSYLPQTASLISPDVLIMIISTNDFRTSVAPSSFREGLLAWVSAWKAACPDMGIILVCPPQCDATGSNPLSSFRDVMRDVALELKTEYYSMYDFLNASYAKSNAQGLWLNGLHLNSSGARYLLNQINKYFLEA